MFFRTLFTAACILFSIASSAVTQAKIDSLKNEVINIKHDSTLCRKYIEIGTEFMNINTDSAIKYFSAGLELAQTKQYKRIESSALNNLGSAYRAIGLYAKAVESYLKCISIDESLGERLGVSKAYNNLGLINSDQANYEKALEYHHKSLAIKEELDDKRGIAGSLTNIGLIYRHQGNYDKAIENYLKSLAIFEEINDKDGISKCYSNLGSIYYWDNQHSKALDFHHKSLELCNQLNDERGKARSYNNIGIIHRGKGEFEKAIEYYQKSLDIFEALGDKLRSAIAHNNIGISFASVGNYDEAVDRYLTALSLRQEIGDKRGMSSAHNSLADTYNTLSFKSKGHAKIDYLNKALTHGQKAYDLAKEIGALPTEKSAAITVKKVLESQGKHKDALYYANKINALNDSIYTLEKTTALAEMQTKYETEKKQQEIVQQQLVIDQQIIESKRQLTQRKFLILFLILSSLLILVILWAFLQKIKSNNIILEKNALLQQANEEILATTEALSAQNDELTKKNKKIVKQQTEIEEQRNSLANLAWELQEINQEVEKQKSLLTKKNKEVTDSIIYAQRIQSAVFPSIHILQPFFTDYYILHKPKSILSGDFYWGTQVNDWLVFCVADCTGHGVPGALMSMLGVAYLNEIVRKDSVKDAAMVLNELRDYIIRSMIQQDENAVNYEGMDIGLCVYNTTSHVLQFSGANIPCWIIPKSEIIPLTMDSLIEIAPDKMPIGFHERMDPFSFTEYQLNAGDRLYICTDGYADQFGGDENKKIQANGLKREICKSYPLPIKEQNRFLHNYFLDWQGEQKQLDDVTLLCIQV